MYGPSQYSDDTGSLGALPYSVRERLDSELGAQCDQTSDILVFRTSIPLLSSSEPTVSSFALKVVVELVTPVADLQQLEILIRTQDDRSRPLFGVERATEIGMFLYI